jgi:hypothetical protein
VSCVVLEAGAAQKKKQISAYTLILRECRWSMPAGDRVCIKLGSKGRPLCGGGRTHEVRIHNEQQNANICGADTKHKVQPCWTKMWDVSRDYNFKYGYYFSLCLDVNDDHER